MSKSSNTSAAEKLPLVHPNQAALPGSIPELDSLKTELATTRALLQAAEDDFGAASVKIFETQIALEERDLELSNLKVEHARLKDGVKELINCVAWYATSLNWMRRLDGKDRDQPPAAHTTKWTRAQECLELVNKLLKG